MDRIHAVTICTVVMLLDAFGRTEAVRRLDDQAAEYEHRGYPRPYTL
ncbi:hypothetical protein ACWEV4_34805 [Streptomyces sp. NPDC003860]